MQLSISETRNISQLITLKREQQMNLEAKLGVLRKERGGVEDAIRKANFEKYTLGLNRKSYLNDYYHRLIGQVAGADIVSVVDYEMYKFDVQDAKLGESVDRLNHKLADFNQEISEIQALIKALSKKQEKYAYLLD